MENDRLGGSDPYSASKASTEIMIKSYVKTFFSNQTNIRIATARAGNVIGGGDWSNSRIIPDCVKSWTKNKTMIIRSPNSTRPWQHVLEPLRGYLILAKNLYQSKEFHGTSFNFGPNKNMKKKRVIDKIKEFSKKLNIDINKIILKNNLHKIFKFEGVWWRPSFGVIDGINKNYLQVLRKNLVKNRILIGNSFNFCYSHLDKKIYSTLLKCIEKALKDTIKYKKPKKFKIIKSGVRS